MRSFAKPLGLTLGPGFCNLIKAKKGFANKATFPLVLSQLENQNNAKNKMIAFYEETTVLFHRHRFL